MKKIILTFHDNNLEKQYRAQLQTYLFEFFTCGSMMNLILGLFTILFGWDKDHRTQSVQIAMIFLLTFVFLLWTYIYYHRQRVEQALLVMSCLAITTSAFFQETSCLNTYQIFTTGGNAILMVVIWVFALEFKIFLIQNLVITISRIGYGLYIGAELPIQQIFTILILHIGFSICIYFKELKHREFFLLSIKNNQLEQAFGLLQNEPYAIFQFHKDTLEFKQKQLDLYLFGEVTEQDYNEPSNYQKQLIQFLRKAKIEDQTLEQFVFKQIKEIPLEELYKLKIMNIQMMFNKKKYQLKMVQIYQEYLTFYLTIQTNYYKQHTIETFQRRYQQFKAKYLSMFESVTQTNLKLLLNKLNPLKTSNKLTKISLEVLIFFKLTHMEDQQLKQIELAGFVRDILDKYSFGNITLVNYQNSTIKSYPTLLCLYFLFVFTTLKQNTQIYIKIINEINENIQVIIYKDLKAKQSKPFKVLENYLLFDKRIVPNESTTFVFTQEPKIPFSQNLIKDLKNQQLQ